VLGKFRPDETEQATRIIELAAEALLAVAADGVEKAMNQYNIRPQPERDGQQQDISEKP
jgi:peptidyl-tRNA hydrolase